MNLNQNPRFEQFDMTEGDAAYDLVKSIEESLPVLPRTYSNFDAEQATGVRNRGSSPRSGFFRHGGLKTWNHK